MEVEVIDSALKTSGGSLEAALEALLVLQADPALVEASNPGPHDEMKAGELSIASCSPDEEHSSMWGVLPQECKRLILEHMSIRDLAMAARVCREFAAHARDSYRNRLSITIPHGLPFEQMRTMCRVHVSVVRVSLAACRQQLRHPLDFQRAFQALAEGTQGRLEVLDLRQSHVSNADIAALLHILPGVKDLSLASCDDLTDDALKLLAAHRPPKPPPSSAGPGETGSPSPRHSFGAGDLTGFSFQEPASSNSNIIGRRMGAVAHQSREERLRAQQPKAGEGIRALSLRKLQQITDDGVKLLTGSGATARSLTSLDVSGCPRLTDDALSLSPNSPLQIFRAGQCNSIRFVSLRLPGGCMLKEISLPGCVNLQGLELSIPHLETVNVANCKSLQTVTADCPELKHLSLALCSRLMDSCLEVDFPGLEEVNLKQCHSLTSAGIERIVWSAAGLRELNANGCTLVSRLLMTSHEHLEALDVAGCRSLVTLRSNSQKLRRLVASGCSSLKNLELATPELEKLDLRNTAVDAALARHLSSLLPPPA